VHVGCEGDVSGCIQGDQDRVVRGGVLDLLFPPSCPGCGREGDVLCDRCSQQLERRMAEPAAAPLGLPVELPVGLVQLEWCAPFTGAARAAIHALKYDGEQRLAAPLARRWGRASGGGELLVPVPVHPERLRERGFNQAALLARSAGRSLGLPLVEALRREQATVAQYGLGRGARTRNVGDAFVADPSRAAAVVGRWVVLVDDVVTTGATLSACAASLRRAGATSVAAVTVARER
jgi:ComF family protein